MSIIYCTDIKPIIVYVIYALNFSGLPNYWDESNEWYGMSRQERDNKFNWLTKVIAELERNKDSKEVWAKRFDRRFGSSEIDGWETAGAAVAGMAVLIREVAQMFK